MKIKKDILLSFSLVVLSGCLLFVAKADSPERSRAKSSCSSKISCCKRPSQPVQKPETPWNFVTEGILHISA